MAQNNRNSSAEYVTCYDDTLMNMSGKENSSIAASSFTNTGQEAVSDTDENGFDKSMMRIVSNYEDHLRQICGRFRERAELVRCQMVEASESRTCSVSKKRKRCRSGKHGLEELDEKNNNTLNSDGSRSEKLLSFGRQTRRQINYGFFVINPSGFFYLFWSSSCALAFTYNCVSIPLLWSFDHYCSETNVLYWHMAEYFCDLIYVVDLVVKSRTRFLDYGVWRAGSKEMALAYMAGVGFKFDLLSLLPLDLISEYFGHRALFRLVRLLKIRVVWGAFQSWDRHTQKFMHVVRVVKTLAYMSVMTHYYTCLYHRLFVNNKRQPTLQDKWNKKTVVYQGSIYGYVFFHCFKTILAIGDNPKPVDVSEYIIASIAYIIALFFVAFVIGQVRYIFHALQALETHYRWVVDNCLTYLYDCNIDAKTRTNIRAWLDYNWKERKTLDETDFLSLLPHNLLVELAINVHYEALRRVSIFKAINVNYEALHRVSIFKNCEKSLIYALVLKLKSQLYLPGEVVCQKGAVGREMFIVRSGVLDVIIADRIVTTLKAGSVLGEVSLLTIGGRRTADVVSNGYSHLFALYKTDFNEVINNFPATHRLMKDRAHEIIERDKSSKHRRRKTAPTVFRMSDDVQKSKEAAPIFVRSPISMYRMVMQAMKTMTGIMDSSQPNTQDAATECLFKQSDDSNQNKQGNADTVAVSTSDSEAHEDTTQSTFWTAMSI